MNSYKVRLQVDHNKRYFNDKETPPVDKPDVETASQAGEWAIEHYNVPANGLVLIDWNGYQHVFKATPPKVRAERI